MAILHSPHTGPQLNSSPTYSSSLFLSLEKTPHLRNHWGCFLKVSVWQGDRGHHSLPFSNLERPDKIEKGVSVPSPKSLSTPAPNLTISAAVRVDSPGRFLDLPLPVWYQLYCERLTKNRKPWGQLGRPEVSSISLRMMDAARRPGHLKMNQTRWPNAHYSAQFASFTLPFLIFQHI